MEHRDDTTAGVALLLLEPEIVAWLDDYRREPREDEDDEPPRAA